MCGAAHLFLDMRGALSTGTSSSYIVTGAREVTTQLTVHDDGRWEVAEGSLYDVTHLPCRSALYTAGGTRALLAGR